MSSVHAMYRLQCRQRVDFGRLYAFQKPQYTIGGVAGAGTGSLPIPALSHAEYAARNVIVKVLLGMCVRAAVSIASPRIDSTAVVTEAPMRSAISVMAGGPSGGVGIGTAGAGAGSTRRCLLALSASAVAELA